MLINIMDTYAQEIKIDDIIMINNYFIGKVARDYKQPNNIIQLYLKNCFCLNNHNKQTPFDVYNEWNHIEVIHCNEDDLKKANEIVGDNYAKEIVRFQDELEEQDKDKRSKRLIQHISEINSGFIDACPSFAYVLTQIMDGVL